MYITQKSLGPEHVTETTSLNSRPERGKPRLRSSSELCSRSEDLSEASVLGVPSGPHEEDRLSPALLSHPGLQPPAALRLPASRQAPVGAARGELRRCGRRGGRVRSPPGRIAERPPRFGFGCAAAAELERSSEEFPPLPLGLKPRNPPLCV